MMYFGPGMGGWAMVLMMLGNVIFWTVLILGAVVVARFWRSGPRDGLDHTQPRPQQLLAERFARGEITADDYHHSLRILSNPYESHSGGRT